AGFIGKYVMFLNAMDQYKIYLVAFAILNALVGFYYYFRVIAAMYFKEGAEVALVMPLQYKIVMAFSVVLTVFLGIYPSLILNLI
ncbi:MAG: dehydrogenase, partial [Pedobacter sp.]|nr:dehydrogenase [Pedobacter sp.]